MKLIQNAAIFVACLAGTILPGEAHAVPLRNRPYLPPQPVDWNGTWFMPDLDGKPWREVLDWFAAESGLTITSRSWTPNGTMRFVGPKGKDGQPRAYALKDIYDIINERLQNENFALVRGDKTLTIVSGDDKPWIIPRIPVWELKNRGRTEIVAIIVRVPPGWDQEEFVRCSKRLLGPFCQITTMKNGEVLLRSSVGILEQMLPEIQMDAR